jgi:NhaP-type Na+/H+ or K+/H+ antiporter
MRLSRVDTSFLGREARMDAAGITVIALVVFGWGLLSARLSKADLSAPMVFVGVGVMLSEVLDVIDPNVSHETIKVLAELTLVLVLFADAARVRLRDLQADLGLYARLLGLGLPLTILAGTMLALVLFDGMGFWIALLIGAALAPTDAALGAAVMTDPAVPMRVRRVLNVESGLNDGIATPVVTVAIAGAAVEGAHAPTVGGALVDLAIGVAIGIAVGLAGGRAMRAARRRGWASEDLAGPAVLSLSLVAYAGTLAVDGNGFVAAFVGGLLFGNVAGRGGAKEVFFVEQTAGLISLMTWLLFGAVAVPIAWREADWQVVVYAVLSLTAVRILPVLLGLLGAGLSRSTVAFIGWFGPRGLASIIFALIALEDLHGAVDRAVAVIATTVLLSVLAHGLSARPLAARFGATNAGAASGPPEVPGSQPPVRGLLQSHSHAAPALASAREIE